MNNFDPRKRLLRAAAGGIAGYLVLLLAFFIAIILALGEMSIALGPSAGPLPVWEKIILYVFVPTLISIGAAIPAWVLGANLWRGFLAGVAAMAVSVYIHVSGGRINYAPFIEYETVAFVVAIFVTVLIATMSRDKFRLRRQLPLLILAMALILLRFVLAGKDVFVHFAISLFAWIVLPLAAAFVTNKK